MRFIDQQVNAPALLLQVFGVLQQLQVVQEEWRLAVVVHLHQRMADEHLARLAQRNALVRNLATGLHRQTKQRGALIHSHTRRAPLPVRFIVLLTD